METVNGKEVMDGWGEKLSSAQAQTVYRVNGLDRPRIRYGQEKYPDSGTTYEPAGTCHDCAAMLGQYHVPGCDVERCPVCGGQMISCDCEQRLETP